MQNMVGSGSWAALTSSPGVSALCTLLEVCAHSGLVHHTLSE